jgi:hypothetical protein
MSDSRSSEDGVEKHRLALKDNEIELSFFETLEKIGILKFEKYQDPNTGKWHSTPAWFRFSLLQTTVGLDLSGREWDDDYSPEDG